MIETKNSEDASSSTLKDIMPSIENELVEDSHPIHFWQPLSFKMDKDFKFIHDGLLFTIASNLLYAIAIPILAILNKVCFGFKIIGKENLKQLKGGKVTISNHVHYLDCTMVGLSNLPHKTFFTSLQSNFKIPIVRQLITLLNTIPIPKDFSCKKSFLTSLYTLLQKGKTIHFYPEGSLWPYHKKIRHFKKGAFDLAVHSQVPIVPMVFQFVEPTGILHNFLKTKPCIQLKILEPIYPDTTLSPLEASIQLRDIAYKKMTEALNDNASTDNEKSTEEAYLT